MDLGLLARSAGDYARARALLTDALAARRAVGDGRGVGLVLAHLGELARLEGDHARAAEHLRESLTILRSFRDVQRLCRSVRVLGLVALAQGEPIRAIRLLAAAATHAPPGAPIEPAECVQYADGLAAARAALDAEAAETARSEGLAMSLDQAIDYALSAL
jgi:hypothetical protein